MDAAWFYGKFLLFADALLIVGIGLFLLIIPRSQSGPPTRKPMLALLGGLFFAEIGMGLVYLGILLLIRRDQ